MKMSKRTYARLARAREGRAPLGKNCACAFATGGGICTVAELLRSLLISRAGMEEAYAGTLTSIALVFFAVLLTGLGVFHRIARVAGAGTLVPITGFANAVASPAIDSRAEGLVLGVGTKIFTVAGPVLLYGTFSGFVYGMVYYLFTRLA